VTLLAIHYLLFATCCSPLAFFLSWRFKIHTMGLLNQKGKGSDKKKNSAPKNAGSKFIASKSTKAAGGPKKPMTGGSQRGS
jgi:hypothetical protein